jgi:capsular polysaccharide biosynthesis protein
VEIDEVAARLVKQYWALIVACLVVPVVAIGLITFRQPALYSADARIITGSVVPATSAQAGAIVSQVEGIATSRQAVLKALFAAGVTRNLNKFIASNISVASLGSSQVVDVTVTDTDPHVATTVARVLASEVVSSINNVGRSGLSAALQAVDKEIVKLTEQRSILAQQQRSGPRDPQTQAKLAGLDEVIASFTGDRGRLLLQASTQGLAAVIDKPALPHQPVSKALPQKLGLAGVLGLVFAILIAAVAETMRPTVPGARRVGRRLGAPTLGQLSADELVGEPTPGLANMALRLQLAAAHAGVHSVALVDIDSRRPLGALASALERAAAEFTPQVNGGPVTARGNLGAMAGGTATVTAGILTRNHELRSHEPITVTKPLRIYPMGQMKHMAGAGGVGLLVLSGPVARVSRITALDDLVTSSGWPMLGIVAVPRFRRRRPGAADAVPQAGIVKASNGAGPDHAAEGGAR